jgi:uncharacterized membrane protein YfcA
LLLFGVGCVAGTINLLAGGGSLLTLPVLIFLGLPPTVANGTNRVAILMQNVGAVTSFRRHGLVEWGWIKTAALPGALGAVLGSWLGTQMDDDAFRRILAMVMMAVALYTILDPFGRAEGGDKLDPELFPLGRVGLSIAFFVAGVYGGFIQVGVGFILLGIAAGAGLDLVRGNALKVLIGLGFTVPALVIYSRSAMVDWQLGAALGAGNLVGGLLGVRLNVLKGQSWIRGAVTVAVVVMAIRLWTS